QGLVGETDRYSRSDGMPREDGVVPLISDADLSESDIAAEILQRRFVCHRKLHPLIGKGKLIFGVDVALELEPYIPVLFRGKSRAGEPVDLVIFPPQFRCDIPEALKIAAEGHGSAGFRLAVFPLFEPVPVLARLRRIVLI